MIRDLSINTQDSDEMVREDEFSGETQEENSSSKKPHDLKIRVGHKGGKHYEYVKDLPENYETITSYNGWKFNGLFYKDEVFYAKAGDTCRKLIQLDSEKGGKHVNLYDTNGVFRAISFKKFCKEHGIKNLSNTTSSNTANQNPNNTINDNNSNTINEDN
jgi:hypothetical protein